MDAHFDPDSALATGDVVGFNAAAPTAGTYDAKEIYGELRVPVVEQQFIDRLEVNGGFRYSKYSLQAVGGVWTYFAGAELSPIKDIMLRAQYQRAIRAPNISELFAGNAAGFPVATDPCATAAPLTDATVRAMCIATGVPAALYANPGPDADGNGIPDAVEAIQPNSQIEGNFPGNPNLHEEQGDTWTAGVVLRPRFIPRLNVAVDWYKIRVKGATGLLAGGLGGVLNQCINVIQDINSQYCQAINRDPSGTLSGGGVFVVQVPTANIAELDTKGVDVQVDYSLPLSFGLLGQRSKLSGYWFGNYTKDASFIPVPGSPALQCAGKWGAFSPCGEPTPKFKWTSRLAWADGPLTTSLRWRHIGHVVDDTPGSGNFDVESIPSFNYFDLAFALDVTDKATMTFGINNLFDKKPPLMGSTSQQQANTWPSTYDPLGRDFFFSVNFKL
jgi:outer membrane receptor protein involved in Fe transport